MSSYEVQTQPEAVPAALSADCAKAIEMAAQLADLMRKIEAYGDVDQIPTETLQAVFTAGVTMLAAKFDSGERCLPLPVGAQISATAIMIAATGLLKSANLELFELGMWQSWSGTR
jgi:hypothetical protein